MVQSCSQLAIPALLPIRVRVNIKLYYSSNEPCSDGLVPYAETQLASFNPAQPYDIFVHLIVPAAQSNYDIGNFMTTLILSDPSSRILTTVRKPVSSRLDFTSTFL